MKIRKKADKMNQEKKADKEELKLKEKEKHFSSSIKKL